MAFETIFRKVFPLARIRREPPTEFLRNMAVGMTTPLY
jgi:hypothetical protein